MTKKQPINFDWHFYPEITFDATHITYPELNGSFEVVHIPHTVAVTPLNYFSESLYSKVTAYTKTLTIPSEMKNQLCMIEFGAVAHIAHVFVNQAYVGTHYGGYTEFTLDLTPHVQFGDENQICVVVDSRETSNLPPFGHVIDYMTYGGIYREVTLLYRPDIYIESINYETHVDSSQVKRSYADPSQVDRTHAFVQIQTKFNQSLAAEGYTLEVDIWDDEQLCYHATYPISDAMTTHTAEVDLDLFTLWSIENPKLYQIKVALKHQDTLIDTSEKRAGFRQIAFKSDGFYLNGKKTILRGLNRHQSYPYVGYAMPERPQKTDADLLKYALGCNAVRTSHYPQSHHFIDRCDELGLLVFTEIPGWQHIGDSEWKAIALTSLREMILAYRHHPSIILWGVRINESQDDDEFYQQTNVLAKALDPSRPTGGVRYIRKSNLLEDVYTFNDFSHIGSNVGALDKSKVTPDVSKAYLVSEFNGHMYPTKSYDSIQRRSEHARRHFNVLDAIYKSGNIAGGFGWCFFDYNTHQEFGSGDRICHHGVTDIFRNPKLAAAVYASQQDEIPILTLDSEMGIGDYPAGYIGNITAYTNADEVRFYKNDRMIKTFKRNKIGRDNDRKESNELPHPPILIDDFIGDQLMTDEGYSKSASETVKKLLDAGAKYGEANLPLKYKLMAAKLILTSPFTLKDGVRIYSTYIGNWGDTATTYRFEAVKKGEVVAEVMKGPSTHLHIEALTDTLQLHEKDTYDVASIRIQVKDTYGNISTYLNAPLSLELKGNAELVGPNVISLQGGMTGTYIKTIGLSGPATLTIKVADHDEIEPVTLSFECFKS